MPKYVDMSELGCKSDITQLYVQKENDVAKGKFLAIHTIPIVSGESNRRQATGVADHTWKNNKRNSMQFSARQNIVPDTVENGQQYPSPCYRK